MDSDCLINNLTNPALLFFILGVLAVQFKSDLQIPKTSSQFISLYLLFSIGFKGGQELAHGGLTLEVLTAVVLGVVLAALIPLYVFFITRKRLGAQNAGAVAAAYGSISAITFITGISFLEHLDIEFHSHMIAVMTFMEAPAIVVGMFLMKKFAPDSQTASIKDVLKHALTNGSVFLIAGSLIIGFVTSEENAQGIAPFVTDIFKGFLVIFLLDMGIESGKRLKSLKASKFYAFGLALLFPLFNGTLVAILTKMFIQSPGDRFLFAILAASASYIAVPAAMRIAAPKANPGIYITMALAITFPLNITLGFPVYYSLIEYFQ
ncbi:MAG: sodium-dependent bicarbonate transport family permease [Flavobacteriales bacterium]|nr:sodium-dependent bicarbonate transport family permease [Flavobacteriales bacterium]